MPFLKKIGPLLRVSHWSKAIFVLLGVVYAGNPFYWGRALLAALSFCLIASAVYIYNDLRDLEEDKTHPQKSNRPLAKGDVSIPCAWGMLILCLLIGLLLGYAISTPLLVILCIYLLINLLYNHWLRRVLFWDVLCIASGFMLRILAGTFGIGLPITWWLTITATLLSLFIALCKRRLEMQRSLGRKPRAVLRKYSRHLLDILIASTASSCFISYLLYTVYARHETWSFLVTLPLCVIGLWRFALLTTRPGETDDPVAVFLSDKVSCINLALFFSLTLLALF